MKLVFNDQGGWERSVELNDQNNVLMIGRNADCGIQTGNASVSRVHAMVTWRNGKLYVQDPPNGRPTNGTKVDGMRLQPGEVLELFAGSELLCGNFMVRVAREETSNPDVAQMGEQVCGSSGGGYAPGSSSGGMPSGGGYSGRGYQGAPSRGGYPGDNGRVAGQGMAVPGQCGRTTQGGAVIGAVPVPVQPQGQTPGNAGADGVSGSASPQRVSHVQAGFEAGRAKRNRYVGNAPSAVASAVMPVASGVMPVANAPVSSGVMPVAGGGVGPDELLRLKDENASLRRELDSLHSGAVSTDDAVRELREKLDEREQVIADCKRRDEYHESVVGGLNEMIKNLKEQLEHQKEQYQECRKDLVTSQDEAENLRMELSSLKENLESKGMATSNAETAIADLKVQLQQKNRLLSDLQRELDLSQFSCKEERENVERLKENVETLNASLEESQRRNRDMKKVVEQHEMMFSELKGNLDDRAREIRQLQDTLRSRGGADTTALMQELSQVREALNRRTSECEMYQKQLAAAEESLGSASASADEVSKLKLALEESERATAQKLLEADALSASLKSEIERLRNENRELASGGDGLTGGPAVERLREVYQGLNDHVSQWREELSMLEDSVGELQRVFVAYVKIDVRSLQPQDRARLEGVLREHDPKILFEDIGNSLDTSQSSLREIKDKLKELRSALQT